MWGRNPPASQRAWGAAPVSECTRWWYSATTKLCSLDSSSATVMTGAARGDPAGVYPGQGREQELVQHAEEALHLPPAPRLPDRREHQAHLQLGGDLLQVSGSEV